MTWIALDHTARIRNAAAASLLGYVVTADNNAAVPVEIERATVVEDGAMPRILLYADDEAVTESRGGTAPAFEVTMTLVVQALAQRAVLADCIADIDAMVAQIKDCLFGDPAWVKLSQNLGSVKTKRQFKAEGRRFLGDARVEIECSWKELYPPRVSQPLATVTLTTEPPLGTQAIAAGATLTV